MKEDIRFSTAGFRGEANTELSPETCISIASAVASWLKQSSTTSTIFLGMDNRNSSPMLLYSLAGGLSSFGINVDISNNPIPTPLLVFETKTSGYTAGIMITGSHLPPSENGFVLITEDGNYFKGALSPNESKPVKWNKLGKIKVINFPEIKNKYLNHLKAQIKDVKLDLKILIDPAHGPMGEYLVDICKQITYELLTINFKNDMLPFTRPSEPNKQNLKETIKFLKQNNYDLGIATDLDGDRVVFITPDGEIISGDQIGALFAINFWKRGSDNKVVVPLNSSFILSELATKYEKQLVYSKVGAPEIIKNMKENNCIFGFEESGKFFFNPDSLYPDGAFTTIKLLELLSDYKKPLHELVQELPQYSSCKTKIKSQRKLSMKKMKKISESLDELLLLLPPSLQISSISDFEGLKLIFKNNAWILIRHSGTENFIRIFSEHTSSDMAKVMNEISSKFVKRILKTYG